IPVERKHPLWGDLIQAAGRDFHSEYKSMKAPRDGREYVLPPHDKLPAILETARAVRARRMTFGAADNEFQYLSDTSCCCSGVDQFPGFGNWLKHQIGYALRRARGRSEIKYSLISSEWCPSGSVDRYLNSRSRLGSRNGLTG